MYIELFAVGAECAGPDLVRRAAAGGVDPCDGCGRSVIYRTTGRKRRVTTKIESFGALAVALGVTMEELLYGEEEAARIAREHEQD